MRFWNVHEPLYAASASERAEGLVFVKDGFSWPGFFFSLLWLLYHRLWLGTLLYVLISVAIGLAGSFLPIGQWAAFALGLIANLYVGFEGNDLRRRKLERRGYGPVAALTAKSVADAEALYFAGHPVVKNPVERASPSPAGLSHRPETGVLGLFPQPEGRA